MEVVPIAADPQASRASYGWLEAHPDALDTFASAVEDLVETLKSIRTKAADAALCVSPSIDAASHRATWQLGADGHDMDGTPVRAISVVIADLESQARIARLAARDYRAADAAAVERLRKAAEPDI